MGTLKETHEIDSYEHSVVSRVCMILGLATLVAFCQVLNCDFIHYDDPSYVVDNPNVNQGLSPESIIWAFTSLDVSYWHPVTWLSHMLDCQLYGLKPAGHHFTNLIIHMINTLLLFWLLKSATLRIWPSAFVAGLFALHPLHVESVAWISERKDVLSTMFWLLTATTYVWYVRRSGLWRYLLVIVLFMLGIMSKPMIVTLPFVLLLLDYWPLQRLPSYLDGKRQAQCHRHWFAVYRPVLEKIPLFVISGVVAYVTLISQNHNDALKSSIDYSVYVRVANALIAYATYIFKMVIPIRLAIFYPHPGNSVSLIKAVAAAGMLIFITIGVFRIAKKRPYFLVGWLWFVGTLLPVIGLIQVGDQAMADRYTYISLIGLFIIISWGCADIMAERRSQYRVLEILAVSVLMALGISTAVHLRHWRNSTLLFGHAARVTKDNILALGTLGLASLKDGDYVVADDFFEQSLAINPDFMLGRLLYGKSQLQQGKLEKAEEQFKELLQRDPNGEIPHQAMVELYERQNKPGKALSHLTSVIEYSSFPEPAMRELIPMLLEGEHVEQKQLHRIAEVLEQYCGGKQAGNAIALDALAVCYYVSGRAPEALAKAEEALGRALSGNNRQLTASIRMHLALFRSSQIRKMSPQATP